MASRRPAPAVQLHRSIRRMLGCADTGSTPEAETVSSAAIATVDVSLRISCTASRSLALGLSSIWRYRLLIALPQGENCGCDEPFFPAV